MMKDEAIPLASDSRTLRCAADVIDRLYPFEDQSVDAKIMRSVGAHLRAQRDLAWSHETLLNNLHTVREKLGEAVAYTVEVFNAVNAAIEATEALAVPRPSEACNGAGRAEQ